MPAPGPRSRTALALAAAAGLVLPGWGAGGAVPATAAVPDVVRGGCAGVRVVVEPPEGPASSGCTRSDGTRTAAEVLEAAGHALDRVERFPGAVCRVDGVPADDPCLAMPPADASWGFFDTAGGEWHYATAGVDAVRPPSGSAVALVWQDGAEPEPPAGRPDGAGDRAAADGGEDAPGAAGAEAEADGLPAWAPYAALGTLGVVAVLLVRRRRT